jgi:hypothetical protein
MKAWEWSMKEVLGVTFHQDGCIVDAAEPSYVVDLQELSSQHLHHHHHEWTEPSSLQDQQPCVA